MTRQKFSINGFGHLPVVYFQGMFSSFKFLWVENFIDVESIENSIKAVLLAVHPKIEKLDIKENLVKINNCCIQVLLQYVCSSLPFLSR